MEKDFVRTYQKDKNSKEKIIFVLPLIFLAALILRFYYTPYGIPLTLDAFTGYFLYALDISILGHLPNYSLSQSGWSEFLSLFFMSFHSDNLLEYHNLQRTVSVMISGITVIPIYFICKKFFNSYYSMIGAAIFALQPRLIMNSTLGITEPLYIFAISLGILFFLNVNKKIVYTAFGFFAWATIIRPEGQFWLVGISIIYFFRFRKNRKDLVLYLVCLVIFLLVLSPIVIHRIQCCENDGIVSRFIGEINNNVNSPTKTIDEKQIPIYGPNYFDGVKLLGWSLIPIFIIFVPIGLIPIFKNMKFPNYMMIGIPLVLAIPIIYSVSIAPDTRYVYPIFPIFCIISVFGIRFLSKNFKKEKLVACVIILSIILGSGLFLDFKKIDYEKDEEMYNMSKILIHEVKGVNKNTPVKFFKVVEIENRWPIEVLHEKLRNSFEINLISVKNFNTLEKFVEKNKEKELTHIIVGNDDNMPDFLLDVFQNEEKYQYLNKEFDSKEHNYKYHVKKFKIDYNKFESSK